MKTTLIFRFLVISITLSSCSSSGGDNALPPINIGGGGISCLFSEIQYHESDNCDDSLKVAGVSVGNLDQIESQLSEMNIDECVLVTFIGIGPGSETVENGYIFNDVEKSWLIIECRN